MSGVVSCSGSGGYVYTYEGPQFGAHILEESCEKCDAFHPSTTLIATDTRSPAVVLGLGVFLCLVGLSTSVVFYIGKSRGFW